MELFIGTSAFSVKEWKGSFYPERLPDKEMLPYYAERLPAVEINNTFYRAPKAAVLESWAAQVPEAFRFTLKAPQSITHFKRLKGAEETTEYFVSTVRTLGRRLGALLFQLPPNMPKDLPRLEHFLSLLPADVPIAFEFRHASWLEDDSLDLLRAHERALCISETDEAEARLIKTAGWGYLRLRRAGYSDSDLADRLSRIRDQGWEKAYVFLKHEDSGTGPRLAQELMALAG